MLWFIAYFIVNGILSLIVASFFDKKKIGIGGVFIISLLFTPLIGILIGIVSEKKPVIDKSPKGRIEAKKKMLLADIETLNKEKELGLISEDGLKRLNDLKEDYQSLDESAIRREIKRESERRKSAENRFYKKFMWVVVITLLLLLTAFLWMEGYFDNIRFNIPSFD